MSQISNTFLIREVISAARELAHSTSQHDIISGQEKNIYKSAVLEIFNMIGFIEDPTYNRDIQLGETHEIYGGIYWDIEDPRYKVINLTLLKYDKIISVEDSIVGEGVKIDSYSKFANLRYSQFKNTNYSESMIWIEREQSVHILYGENAQLGGVLTFNYRRLPVFPLLLEHWNTWYMDLPDKYYPVLLHRMASMILYQKTGQNLEPSLKFIEMYYNALLGGMKTKQAEEQKEIKKE